MGKKFPKMLIPVLGRPLLYWTLKNLEKCGAVHSIVVAVPADHRRVFETKIRRWRFKKIIAVVNGGREREDSTRNALRQVPKESRWIGIHDGARPAVSPALVKKCFESAKKYGSAILAVPCKDTIKMVGPDSCVEKTIPREACWAAQTPQVFHRKIAEKIHRINQRKKKSASAIHTDDASLAEAFGFKVRLVRSSYENMKVTTPEDLAALEKILKRK